MPYPDQLRRKEAEMRRECVGKLMRQIRGTYHHRRKELGADRVAIPPWVQSGVGSVVIDDIRGSPLTTNYRNKCVTLLLMMIIMTVVMVMMMTVMMMMMMW
jgi:hypothetical protein